MAMRTPTTRSVLVSGSDDATVRIWDLGARGLLCARLEAHQGKVNAVAVGDLHGRPIAVSGGNDRTVRVWDLEAGGPLGGPLVHDRFVNAVAVGKLGDRSPEAAGDAEQTPQPMVATALPDPGGEAAVPLATPRVDHGCDVGGGEKSSTTRRRREGRAAAARGSDADTTKPRWLVLVSIGMVLLGLVLVVVAVRDLVNIVHPRRRVGAPTGWSSTSMS